MVEYTNPLSPQQSGITERLKKGPCRQGEIMFADTDLPKDIWAEA